MNYKLKVLSCAEQDIEHAVLWYENKLKGLGSRFLLSIDATLQSIKRNPNRYPIVYKNFRRALIQRFPYSIFYFIENYSIIIIAVYHEKRNPENWKLRL